LRDGVTVGLAPMPLGLYAALQAAKRGVWPADLPQPLGSVLQEVVGVCGEGPDQPINRRRPLHRVCDYEVL